ncbi:hypothetical protein EDB19DRAFT_1666738 [Suillus lakei]|nr:hypothetical protein EDB19DRAFT_1666738 [Suillus lakei]
MYLHILAHTFLTLQNMLIVFHSGGIESRIMIARKQEYNDTKNHHDGCETQMKRIDGEDAGDWNEERSSPAGHHKLTCPRSKNHWQPIASEHHTPIKWCPSHYPRTAGPSWNQQRRAAGPSTRRWEDGGEEERWGDSAPTIYHGFGMLCHKLRSLQYVIVDFA